jgi:filamentous hemagglutinin family protein
MNKIKLLFASLFLYNLALINNLPIQAQIIPDNTLGNESSQINSNVLINGLNADKINGGATRGSNLFHSFSEFNIKDGQRVYFANPSGVLNILTRVTGKDASSIFGTLGVDGNANLFLMNPNGILFGQNASLDIRGSFVGTTANGLQFGNQGVFSATNPEAPALLTINPNALFFNQINQNATIQNNASTTGLVVDEGKSLLLVGGNISMDGGILFAPGGRVELGGLAEAGNVGIQQDGNIFSLNFPVQVERADVLLNNGAITYVASGGGGSINIDAQNIDILQGSQIFAGINEDLGTIDSKAGDVTLNATRAIQLEKDSFIINTIFNNGNGGDIRINTKDLFVRDGAQINTGIFGAGKAGNLTINASGNVELIGTSTDGNASSALRSFTLSGSTGDAGNLTITTQNLFVQDGALVGSSTSGSGKAGNLTVNASGKVELIGTSANFRRASGLFASTEESTGNAGDLIINTQDLLIKNGAQVSAGTFSGGKGGNLTVNASRKVELIGVAASGNFASVLSTSTGKNSTGNAGNLTINTQDLLVQGGAGVTASTFGFGAGGNLIINVDSKVELIGKSTDNRATSGLFVSANPGSTGSGGNLTVNTQDLLVRDGANISASTFGKGKGGNLTVNASRKVELTGTSVSGSASSGLFARANEGSTGDGGNVTVNTQNLLVQDGALVSTSTLSSGKGGNLTVNASDKVELIGMNTDYNVGGLVTSADPDSTGDAGDLTINTQDLLVQNGALVDTSTFSIGKGGNLIVNASKQVQLIGTSEDGIPSGLVAFARPGSTGNAGSLTVNTQDLLVRDRAGVFVNSLGTGNAGILAINSDRIRLDNKASLNANTRSPNKDPNKEQATINLNTNALILRRNSNITTNATGQNVIGGNINIDAGVIAAFENSDISANSTDFRGGRVSINAEAIFGTQARNLLTPESDITATGADPSLNGTTEINLSDVDPSKGLIELPGGFEDKSDQIDQLCGRNRIPLGSFVVVGKNGSIPSNPVVNPMQGDIDFSAPATLDESNSTNRVNQIPDSLMVQNPRQNRIVEAQAIVRGADGDLYLVAEAPNAIPNSHPAVSACVGVRR